MNIIDRNKYKDYITKNQTTNKKQTKQQKNKKTKINIKIKIKIKKKGIKYLENIL